MNSVYSLLLTLVVIIAASTPASAQTYYFHNDHLGTPQVLTDEDQSVVWQAEYDPFGKATETVAAVEQNLRFPGQYLDRETGRHYNYFRTYDPAIGRYLQSDPIGLIGGASTYSYVKNNPMTRIDPYGLIDLRIPGAKGQTSIHANPGPDVTDFRPEHPPAHFHIGKNDGPRVRTDTFTPFSPADARKMTKEQERFCKNLSDETKDLIRLRQANVFKYGKAMLALAALPAISLDSVTRTCQQDPFFCANELPFVFEGL